MKRILSVFLLLFLAQFCMHSLLAQEAVEDSVAKYLALGNSLSDQWQHKEAVTAYQKALQFDPNNYEANWKAGDQYTEFADRLPENQKAEKETCFEYARKQCEKAIQINPQGYEGHFRLAVALGRLALFRGGKEKIKLSKMIKAEGDTALALNPQADLVCHLLGRWHQNLANLSGVLKFFAGIFFGGVPPASNEEAVAFFKRAIEIDPNHIEHFLELARTYEFMDKKELMREPLEKLLELPNVEEDDQKYKNEAGEMLKKL